MLPSTTSDPNYPPKLETMTFDPDEEFVPVYRLTIGRFLRSGLVVKLDELYEALKIAPEQVGTPLSWDFNPTPFEWFTRYVNLYGYQDNLDFFLLNSRDYYVSLDVARELCALEGKSAFGRAIRTALNYYRGLL